MHTKAHNIGKKFSLEPKWAKNEINLVQKRRLILFRNKFITKEAN